VEEKTWMDDAERTRLLDYTFQCAKESEGAASSKSKSVASSKGKIVASSKGKSDAYSKDEMIGVAFSFSPSVYFKL
jgi:hypothetical protein